MHIFAGVSELNRPIAIMIAVIGMVMGLATMVHADNGPHGEYSAMTDKCAACHRAHTAQGDSLLTSESTATDRSGFCYSCHSGGAGAYTDVRNGLYIVAASVPLSYEDIALPKPTIDKPLRGGGFENVRMNVALTGVMTLTVTSSHMASGGSNVVWGYGPTSTSASGGVPDVSLTCTNCHNPHGGAGPNNRATYRLLKNNNPSNSPLFTYGTSVVMANNPEFDLYDEGLKKYVIADANQGVSFSYWDQHVDGTYAPLTVWCSQCHTRYMAEVTGNPERTNSGDAIFKFRHPTNRTDTFTCSSCHSTSPKTPSCLNCHMAHGTGARMGYYANEVPWPDGTTTPNNHERSALLRLDGRGVCMQCHNK